MARVTVEDCIDKVENRFELVLLATQRAKALNSGAPITVERDDDKDSVVALREIAKEQVKTDVLKENLIQSLQTRNKVDQIDDDSVNIGSEEMDDKFEYIEDTADIYTDNDQSLDEEQIFGGDNDIDSENKGF